MSDLFPPFMRDSRSDYNDRKPPASRDKVHEHLKGVESRLKGHTASPNELLRTLAARQLRITREQLADN